MAQDFSKCPTCGDVDYYYGLHGHRCSNPGCPVQGNKRTLPKNGRIPGFQYFKEDMGIDTPVIAWESKELNVLPDFIPLITLDEKGQLNPATMVAPDTHEEDEVMEMLYKRLPNHPLLRDLSVLGPVIAVKSDIHDIPPHGEGFEYDDEPSQLSDDIEQCDEDDVPF